MEYHFCIDIQRFLNKIKKYRLEKQEEYFRTATHKINLQLSGGQLVDIIETQDRTYLQYSFHLCGGVEFVLYRHINAHELTKLAKGQLQFHKLFTRFFFTGKTEERVEQRKQMDDNIYLLLFDEHKDPIDTYVIDIETFDKLKIIKRYE